MSSVVRKAAMSVTDWQSHQVPKCMFLFLCSGPMVIPKAVLTAQVILK